MLDGSSQKDLLGPVNSLNRTPRTMEKPFVVYPSLGCFEARHNDYIPSVLLLPPSRQVESGRHLEIETVDPYGAVQSLKICSIRP